MNDHERQQHSSHASSNHERQRSAHPESETPKNRARPKPKTLTRHGTVVIQRNSKDLWAKAWRMQRIINAMDLEKTKKKKQKKPSGLHKGVSGRLQGLTAQGVSGRLPGLRAMQEMSSGADSADSIPKPEKRANTIVDLSA